MIVFPYRIETLFKHYPIANWVIMGLTVVTFGLLVGEVISEDVGWAMVLHNWSPVGLLGHMLLHGGLMHLAGNMLFLWVFGNAVCASTSNRWYPALYIGFGVAAGVAHMIFNGEPMVGASGAINGVVGMALAMYPENRVSVFWLFFVRFGTFRAPLWTMALLWLAFDLWGALRGGGNVAYWAHLGGFFAGVATGYFALRKGWVELTQFDNRSLDEIFTGKTMEARRARIEAEEAAELEAERKAQSKLHWAPSAPVAASGAGAGAPGDALVMPLTAANLARWREGVETMAVGADDAAIIESGGAAGSRRNYELVYGQGFAALGFSFHRSLANYYRWAAMGRSGPHEADALAEFTGMIEAEFAAMHACGFVDDALSGARAMAWRVRA